MYGSPNLSFGSSIIDDFKFLIFHKFYWPLLCISSLHLTQNAKRLGNEYTQGETMKKFIEGFKKFFFPKFQFGKTSVSNQDIRKAFLQSSCVHPSN